MKHLDDIESFDKPTWGETTYWLLAHVDATGVFLLEWLQNIEGDFTQDAYEAMKFVSPESAQQFINNYHQYFGGKLIPEEHIF